MRVLAYADELTPDGRERGVSRYARKLLSGLAATNGFEVAAITPRGARLPEGVRPAEPGWVADIRFCPGIDPPSGDGPPLVQTLHDLTPLVVRTAQLRRERRRWRRRAPALRRAAAIITPSHHTAHDGIRLLRVEAGRIHVIHHGVDDHFRPGPPSSTEPYLLHLAAWGPHKGVKAAADVAALVAGAASSPRLLFGGLQDPWTLAQIRGQLAQAPRPDLVEVTGWVEDLVGLYRGAAALLVTSRYEGFGLPALEAMACGVPVLGFANSATAEVAGPGALLVADGDVVALAEAVRSVLTHSELRSELVDRGLAHAAGFRWPVSVAAHADVFRSVV